ncbi:MAG TPA: right-handed parallel beta-helix repeat-containing protein [Polyangia bacterium]|jgi:hypothetical protein
MRTLVVIAALAAIVVATVECKRANGAYCDDARPCPNGFACDLTARECHVSSLGGADLAGLSTDMAGCSCSGPTPICVAMQCVSCLSTSDGDAACAAVSSTTPHCEPTGAAMGQCVGCRDAGDCGGTTTFCDDGTHACRGCIADSECPSLICDLTPGSTTHGQCIDTSNVVYADVANGADSNMGLTPTTATKTIMKAVNNAVGLTPARLYVHVAAGTYPESVGVNNRTIYIVGAAGAIINPGGGDGLGAANGGSMTARNLVVTADNGNGGNCNASHFTAYQVSFVNSKQLGVVSMNCLPLTLDGCLVSGNLQGGVTISSGDFTVYNSMLVKNNGAGLFQMMDSANTVFVNNTVADNSAGSGFVGVSCASAASVMVVNTILYNNKGAGGVISETNCGALIDASDDPSAGPQSSVDLTAKPPGFVGVGDYHLAPGSPCINEGTSQGAPDHDYDFQPRPDAKSMIFDIGADEVQ